MSKCFFLNDSGRITHASDGGNYFDNHEHKELTIPQLRDMVVLKRNDRNDRTHTDQDNWSWFISSNGVGYVFGAGNANGLHQWDESSLNMVDLKPVTKAETIMKEYLVKNQNDEYVLLNDVSRIPSEFVVEVPEGADKATLCGDYLIYWKGSNLSFSIKEECEWCCAKKHPNSFFQFDEYMSGHKDALVIWQRDAPNVEKTALDELLELRISDGEIQNRAVNHPSHYTGGGIECIDAMQAMLTEDEFIGYLRGNIFKYQWRYQQKNGIEDLKKSQWYLNKLIEVEN